MTPADGLDIIVLLGLAIMAIAGWRAGLVATTAAFVGFVLGATVAGWAIARVLGGSEISAWLKVVLTVGGMTLLGMVGQALLGRAAGRMRDSVTAKPVRVLDSISGVAVSIGAWLVVMWMLMSVLTYAPHSSASDMVRGSRAYLVLEGALAAPGSQLLADLSNLLTTLEIPALAFNPATVPPARDPRGDSVSADAARSARRSVVSIGATASSCSSSVVGSGIVVGPEQVVTNAHVVASAERVSVRLSGSRGTLDATIVAFDPADDLAILHVAGMEAPVPEWLVSPPRDTPSVVAGYPGGGPLRTEPARVRGATTVPAAHGEGTRKAEVFRGLVRGGNSGGALLDANGRVIGVVFASLAGDENTGLALPASETLPLIRAARGSTAPVETSGCPASFG